MSEQGEATLAATMHPALVTAMALVKGVEYLRLMGDDPYRFLPLAVAPIGTVGELVTGIAAGEWIGGPLVVVRPQGWNAPAPPQPIPSPGPSPAEFDDTNLAAEIDRLLQECAATGSSRPAALRDLLRTAANIALDLGLPLHHFVTCSEVAFGEMERKRK